MPTRRIFRLGIILGVGMWAAGGLVKMAARRRLAEDDAGSIGAKVGATFSQ